MILILSFLGTSVLNHEVKAQRPIKSFFDRVQQIFSNRPPSTSSTTNEYSTLIETEPNTETIDDVNYVAADQSEPEISTSELIHIKYSCFIFIIIGEFQFQWLSWQQVL